MKLFVVLLIFGIALQASVPLNKPSVLMARGASGEDRFDSEFSEWARQIESTLTNQGITCTIVGTDSETNDLSRIQHFLAEEPRVGGELCLIFLGHGTFDAHHAKFNLRGPDLSAADLAKMVERFERPLVFINAFSSSSPFLTKLSGTNRVIITATRSGHEQNYSRFGKYFAETFGNPAGDLDKDGQTSLLETFLAASKKTASFYEREGRLATEHPLIDDNGDGLGTQADFFKGVRVVKKGETNAMVDGLLAHQIHFVPGQLDRNLSLETRNKRAALEQRIETLRTSKPQIPESEYYQKLESLLLDLGGLYDLAR